MKPLLTATLAVLAVVAWAQERPRLARRGAALFREHNCEVCHSINGVGGKEAPDLGRRSVNLYSPSLLAGAMWNHGPAMWKALAAHNLPTPRLEPDDAADLFAYFYSLHYFAPPGDASRGKGVFTSARCGHCHAREGGAGPPVSSWRAAGNPVDWAQQMWNHTAGMTREAEKAGIRWPQLTAQQMVDLMTYVQNLPGVQKWPPSMTVADAEAGQKLFESKSCGRCHTIGGSGAGKIDLLRPAARFHTLAEFAVEMWNHTPQMRRRAAQENVELPVFQGSEMSDLLAYLFDKHYFDERGNAGRGARVYKARRCGACHETGQAGAPNLAQFRGRFSPMFMTSALWGHGPQMLAELEKRGMKWPVFTGTDMIDLITHLNKQ